MCVQNLHLNLFIRSLPPAVGEMGKLVLEIRKVVGKRDGKNVGKKGSDVFFGQNG